jgi:tripartite-type tricarboxylate transporter receptor subunit TctC
MKLRVLAAAAALLGGCGMPAWSAECAAYPSKPVRVIVTVSPGSGGDTATRTITPRLGSAFGQQFVVDNRLGFSGNIGAETAARAAADGYTLLVVYAGNAISQSFHARLGYSLDKSFDAVGRFASVPLALVVHPGVEAKSVREFVALARARPQQIHYASPGNGSLPHMAMRLFELQTGIELEHVPYKSTTTAVAELIGGQTAATFAAIPTALPQVEAGRLRLLGISSAKRSALVPDWPSLAEAGVADFDIGQWYGLVAPAGTPRAVIARLSGELARIVRGAETRAALMQQGIDPVADTPEHFAAYIEAEIAKWAQAVAGAGKAGR